MNGEWLLLVLAIAVAFLFAASRKKADRAKRSKKGGGSVNAKRGEALFRSMFPELQPRFHPRRLVEFTKARRGKPPPAGKVSPAPPGFDAASAEAHVDEKGREQWRMLDAAGALLAQFAFETHREGAAVRVGKGKFTVNFVDDRSNPWVRYWHPDREFKWRNGRWTFTSRVSERSIESGDSGSSFSSDSSSRSSTGTATAAAAAAGIVAAGGAFDGGGASQGWAGPDAGGDGAGATAY